MKELHHTMRLDQLPLDLLFTIGIKAGISGYCELAFACKHTIRLFDTMRREMMISRTTIHHQHDPHEEVWTWNGMLHRKDGPAVRCTKDGRLVEGWWEFDELVYMHRRPIQNG